MLEPSTIVSEMGMFYSSLSQNYYFDSIVLKMVVKTLLLVYLF